MDQGHFTGFQLSRLCLNNIFGKCILKYGDDTFQHPILILSYFWKVRSVNQKSTRPSLATSLFRGSSPWTNGFFSQWGILFLACLLSSHIPCSFDTRFKHMQKIHITRASKVYRGHSESNDAWYNEHTCRRNYHNTKSDERQLS